MPQPQDVQPRKFKPTRILYNQNEFSIAWGLWHQQHPRLAMRWNGESTNPKDMGYPKAFGHPQWMLIDEHLYEPFLQSLIGVSGITAGQYRDICSTIAELKGLNP